MDFAKNAGADFQCVNSSAAIIFSTCLLFVEATTCLLFVEATTCLLFVEATTCLLFVETTTCLLFVETTTCLLFVEATMWLLFFEIYERGLQRVGSVALSKNVMYYGPRSGFPYYNPTTPLYIEGSPYPPPGETLSSSVGLRPGNLHQNQI